MSQARPPLFSGLVLGVEELGGSSDWMQNIRDSQIPCWPESQCSGCCCFSGFSLTSPTVPVSVTWMWQMEGA